MMGYGIVRCRRHQGGQAASVSCCRGQVVASGAQEHTESTKLLARFECGPHTVAIKY